MNSLNRVLPPSLEWFWRLNIFYIKYNLNFSILNFRFHLKQYGVVEFPGGSVVKNPPALQESQPIPRLGRSPGGGPDNTFPYSCLENPMDSGDWWARVHRVAESDTRKRLSRHAPCSGGNRVLEAEIPKFDSQIHYLLYLWQAPISLFVKWNIIVHTSFNCSENYKVVRLSIVPTIQ